MKEEKREQLHISVRELVEFIFRQGDIDNRNAGRINADAMQEGSRLHRKIQKEQDSSYMAEVPLKTQIDMGEYDLIIEGRADGVFTEDRMDTLFSMQADSYCWRGNLPVEDEKEMVFIDEIKGMYTDVKSFREPIYVHQAQAMCYAYFFATQNNLTHIGIQLTYSNLETDERKYFRQDYSMEEITTWFAALVSSYKRWTDYEYEHKNIRQASIHQLQFPYTYREGQHKLMGDVYRTMARGKILFMQAPTGVGKTISTIFPAVKAVGEGIGDRIFYLTAKTITATVAKETFALLMQLGYKGKTIQITAKEKLCVCETMDCNPLNCPYALGHYDRVNDAVYDILQKSDFFTREEILAQAEKFEVCPFEMSLDVSSWVDNIVCDYNYVFDPNVYLKRFFAEGVRGDYLFLVDEAHNLVDRSREMYSAALYKEDFLAVKRILKSHNTKIVKYLERCNKVLLEMKRQCETYTIHEDIGNLLFSLMLLRVELDKFLEKPMSFAGKDEVLDFYFALRNFMNIYDLTDEHYVIYSQHTEDERFMLKLLCVDPSLNLQKCLDKARATIFFSATLLPINYYKSLLSTREDNYAIYAQSPFDEGQRLLAFGQDVSTKYTRRTQKEFEKIADYIQKTVRCKKGNYMVFFPSYKLMEQVAQIYYSNNEEALIKEELQVIVQTNRMKEQEREEFLNIFATGNNQKTLVAFCVMGGIFGEGIDLKNDQLIGVIVVGTGLPQISFEREILKKYYDDKNHSGFDYAFRYPGINKVLQAAGRVIRTTEDEGIILLLDERFLQRDYDALYPREWSKRCVCSIDDVESIVSGFWEKRN